MIIKIALSGFSVLALLIYFYVNDKYEKEPLSFILKVFIGGVLSILTLIVYHPLYDIFVSPFFTGPLDLALRPGITEELGKFTVFMLLIWRNKNFNEPYDGIFYGVLISLGFAFIENIQYVFTAENHIQTGIMRGLFAVPAHTLFGFFMGYFLSRAKYHKTEVFSFPLAIIIPITLHSLYDFIIYSLEGQNQIFMLVAISILLIALIRIAHKDIIRIQEESPFK